MAEPPQNLTERKDEIALRDKTHLLPDIAVQPPEGGSGYEAALWAAGVKVRAYKTFGSYQGDWWAEVELPDGEIGFVNGFFGSCSHCDAFEVEFGYWDAENSPDYLRRLRDFGRRYLTDVRSADAAIAEASRNIEWDSDASEMTDWLKARAVLQETSNG